MKQSKNLTNYMQVQGVPRNMTVGEKFEMASSMIFKLFDTKENKKIIYDSLIRVKLISK